MIPARQSLPQPGPVTLATLLLVEGNTPMHFFEALLRHLSLDNQIEIRNYGGIRDLTAYLATLIVTPRFSKSSSRWPSSAMPKINPPTSPGNRCRARSPRPA